MLIQAPRIKWHAYNLGTILIFYSYTVGQLQVNYIEYVTIKGAGRPLAAWYTGLVGKLDFSVDWWEFIRYSGE